METFTVQQGEEWEEFPNSNGKILVSTLGRVYNTSSQRYINKRLGRRKEYYEVGFTVNGKHHGMNLARLLLLTFKPIIEPHLYEADHKDYDSFNDDLSNLRWLLKTDNNKRRITKTDSFKIYKKLLIKMGDEKLEKHLLQSLNKLK